MDVALFHSAAPCGMEAMAEAMGHDHMDIPCCEDESFTVTGQDDLKLSWNDLDLDTQEFLNVFGTAYLQLFAEPSEEHLPGETYPPPLPSRDLHKVYEVYLIWLIHMPMELMHRITASTRNVESINNFNEKIF